MSEGDAGPMAQRLRIAGIASRLIDAGEYQCPPDLLARQLLDAVRCCEHFPECSHVLDFLEPA